MKIEEEEEQKSKAFGVGNEAPFAAAKCAHFAGTRSRSSSAAGGRELFEWNKIGLDSNKMEIASIENSKVLQ